MLLVVAWAAVGDEEQREVMQQLWLGRDWTKSQKRPQEIMPSRHVGMPFARAKVKSLNSLIIGYIMKILVTICDNL